MHDTALRFECALNEADPCLALYHLAEAFKHEGMSQADMYALFDRYWAKHHHDTDETKYNAILDTMDRIVGWCQPKNRLFDTDLKT